MDHNFAIRHMVAQLRDAMPDVGWKKFTKLVNDRLPPEIQVTKHQVRDFLGTLDEGSEEAEIDEVTAAVADIGSEETEIDEITAAMANINISSEDANPTVPSSSKQDNTPDSPSSPKPRDENFDMVVREFFRLYRNVERNYLLSLKRQFKRQVRTGPNRRVTRPPAFPVTHLRHHIEVLLTLRGVNPATVFRKAHDNDAVARVLTGVVLQCLAPMFEISKFESYGFRLHYIAESSSLGFGGRWVFADSESPRWPLVRDLLFKKTHHLPQPGPGPGPGPAPGAGEVPVRLAGVALGFPAEYSLAETRCVEFLDATEEAFLRREMKGKVCCVEALKFPFGDGNVPEWKAIMCYYEKCRSVVEEFGTELRLNLPDHPSMVEWLSMIEWLKTHDRYYKPEF